jgi:hypothetical protein
MVTCVGGVLPRSSEQAGTGRQGRRHALLRARAQQVEIIIMRYTRNAFLAALPFAAGLLASAPGFAATTDQAPPAQSAPQMATPPPPPNGQQAHRDVISPPPVGDTGINKGAPPPQEFPTPVIHPPPNPTSKPSN